MAPSYDLSASCFLPMVPQALSTMSTDVGLLAAHLPELQLKERAMEVVQVGACMEGDGGGVVGEFGEWGFLVVKRRVTYR